MPFKEHSSSEKEFRILENLLIDQRDHNSKFWINNRGKVKPFSFDCSCEQKSNIQLTDKYVASYSENRFKIDYDQVENFRGFGSYCKLIECEHCNTFYLTGFGFFEPGNGHQILVLHTILRLEEK